VPIGVHRHRDGVVAELLLDIGRALVGHQKARGIGVAQVVGVSDPHPTGVEQGPNPAAGDRPERAGDRGLGQKVYELQGNRGRTRHGCQVCGNRAGGAEEKAQCGSASQPARCFAGLWGFMKIFQALTCSVAYQISHTPYWPENFLLLWVSAEDQVWSKSKTGL